LSLGYLFTYYPLGVQPSFNLISQRSFSALQPYQSLSSHSSPSLWFNPKCLLTTLLWSVLTNCLIHSNLSFLIIGYNIKVFITVRALADQFLLSIVLILPLVHMQVINCKIPKYLLLLLLQYKVCIT